MGESRRGRALPPATFATPLPPPRTGHTYAPSVAPSAERSKPRGGGAREAPRAVGQSSVGRVGGANRREPPVANHRSEGVAAPRAPRPAAPPEGRRRRRELVWLRAQRWWRRRDRPSCNRRPSGSGCSGSSGRARREATPAGSGGWGGVVAAAAAAPAAAAAAEVTEERGASSLPPPPAFNAQSPARQRECAPPGRPRAAPGPRAGEGGRRRCH
ncbi:putative HTLV-1-related endogenous sequence [Grammomys surdaster]|uniref:putative HTLV-1-related endogenous sequence n=1 Tax=Grammomys surdaster TaxID=491861 RepID=UPI00109F86DF|nr:putative HTLV-1-related endogenous sequence [Grammomys surdaster]